jgi:hypothetical protein
VGRITSFGDAAEITVCREKRRFLDTAVAMGYVLGVILRRLIVILCIIAIVPTAIDPSCAGYFMYADVDAPAMRSQHDDVRDDVHADDALSQSVRPAEGLAASRVPSSVAMRPRICPPLPSSPIVSTPCRITVHRDGRTPDFLAPTLHGAFLRNAVLLI